MIMMFTSILTTKFQSAKDRVFNSEPKEQELERRRHDEEVKRRYTPATQLCVAGVDRLEAEFVSVAR